MLPQLELPLEAGRERVQGVYRTISSVWEGEDSELLRAMLDFYPRRPPELILDATFNEGRFWRGNGRRAVGLDIDVTYRPDIVGDSNHLPFKSSAFDVVVYDPPHVPNQGTDKTKDFNTRFGLKLKSSKENGYNFAHTYPPFMREAYRVLKPEGVLFCKISDYVHNHQFQWAHIDVIKAAVEVSFCACDCIVKIRKDPIVDPKWKEAHHARKRHCYWLVFRKSRKCE